MAQLNQDWHGVPAGTELRIISERIDWQGDRIFLAARVDGKQLPTSWGKARSSYIAAEFVDA